MISVKKVGNTVVSKSVLPARKTRQPFVNDIDFGEIKLEQKKPIGDMTMSELASKGSGWFDTRKQDNLDEFLSILKDNGATPELISATALNVCSCPQTGARGVRYS